MTSRDIAVEALGNKGVGQSSREYSERINPFNMEEGEVDFGGLQFSPCRRKEGSCNSVQSDPIDPLNRGEKGMKHAYSERFNPFDREDSEELNCDSFTSTESCPVGSSLFYTDSAIQQDVNTKLQITEIIRTPDSHVRRKKSTSDDNPILATLNNDYDFYQEQHDAPEKLKTKVLSAWNNVKYGWTLKLKTNFSRESPIFLLGVCYHCGHEADVNEFKNYPRTRHMQTVSSFQRFQQDFTSRIWLTYRREFPQLDGSQLTSDCGWGCMLRSGQMMLAQAFIMHFLGRDWRLFKHNSSRAEDLYHRQIIRWFGDSPANHSPFSVHRLVKVGAQSGKKAGDWYGPASVAYILRDAMEQAVGLQTILSQLCLYVAQDCTVFKEDVIQLCTSRNRSSTNASSLFEESGDHTVTWRSVIILIPVRLGSEVLNPIYTPCVKALLAHDSCIGIIGGKPKHSLFFVGWQEEKLIHLDPHYCQDMVDMTRKNFQTHSFHCVSPRKMSISKMDPSCTFGFYCKTQEEFERFCSQVQEIIVPPRQKNQYPMFVIEAGSSRNASQSHEPVQEDTYLRVKHLDSYCRSLSVTSESEDFVFL